MGFIALQDFFMPLYIEPICTLECIVDYFWQGKRQLIYDYTCSVKMTKLLPRVLWLKIFICIACPYPVPMHQYAFYLI